MRNRVQRDRHEGRRRSEVKVRHGAVIKQGHIFLLIINLDHPQLLKFEKGGKNLLSLSEKRRSGVGEGRKVGGGGGNEVQEERESRFER